MNNLSLHLTVLFVHGTLCLAESLEAKSPLSSCMKFASVDATLDEILQLF